MAKRGKRYVEARKLIEKGKAYPIEEAIELVKKTSTVKFDASIDVAFKLGVDPKHADQQLRGAMVLPKMCIRDSLIYGLTIAGRRIGCWFWAGLVDIDLPFLSGGGIGLGIVIVFMLIIHEKTSLHTLILKYMRKEVIYYINGDNNLRSFPPVSSTHLHLP